MQDKIIFFKKTQYSLEDLNLKFREASFHYLYWELSNAFNWLQRSASWGFYDGYIMSSAEGKWGITHQK